MDVRGFEIEIVELGSAARRSVDGQRDIVNFEAKHLTCFFLCVGNEAH
jgi:hypothetical protein